MTVCTAMNKGRKGQILIGKVFGRKTVFSFHLVLSVLRELNCTFHCIQMKIARQTRSKKNIQSDVNSFGLQKMRVIFYHAGTTVYGGSQYAEFQFPSFPPPSISFLPIPAKKRKSLPRQLSPSSFTQRGQTYSIF